MGAYAIRPYRVTGKRINFLRYNVGAYCIRPTRRHPKDGKCAKRGTFSISIMYPASFPGLGRGLDFLLPSFFVSRQGPYRGREVFPGTFLRWILYSSLSLDPFFRFIMYPASFPGLGRGLDFLLPSFLVSRQGPYRGREIFPGTFLRWILYSSLFLDPFFRFIMYPAIFPGLGRGLDFLLPSFLVSRQEKKVETR